MSRDSLIRLLSTPAEEMVIHAYHGAEHEVAIQGPQQPTKVWWEDTTLKARIKVSYTGVDVLDFRHKGESVWRVGVRAGKRRAFTFSQSILVGSAKLGPLLG